MSCFSFAAVQNGLPEIENKINETLEEKVQLSTEKQQLEAQISDLQIKIRERKVILVKRLQALYSMKNFKWSELLVGGDLNQISRNIKILQNLNAYDYELFRDYNSSLKLLAQSRKNLADTDLLLQNNVIALQAQEKNFLKVEELRIATLQHDNIASLLKFKGRLTRPLDGPLLREFGSQRDSAGQYDLVSRGEIYKTKKAAPVKAVGLGAIIFRDLLEGWRETLIVQHDDNYFSVYAGIKNSEKNVGDQVAQGEIIGNTAGEELYFELRHFDNPINPKQWYGERR